MKLFKLSPIAAAFLALPALAIPSGPQAGDIVIYAAGASAQLNSISNLVTKVCDTAAAPIEFYQGFTTATTVNTDLRAYRCTAISGIGIDGKKVIFSYSSLGGSASGVQYVARGLNRTFLNFSACPALESPTVASTGSTTADLLLAPAGSKRYNCNIGTNLTALNVPIAGSSDVEPARFVGDNVPQGETGMEPSDIDALTVKNSRAVIFGLIANDKMWLALQKKQGIVAANATAPIMPVDTTTVSASNSLSNIAKDFDSVTAGVQSIPDATRPSLATWEYRAIAQGLVDNMSKLTGVADTIALARRVNGSGTQAISNITFLNNPCGSEIGSALLPATAADGGPTLIISEGSATSNVVRAVQVSPFPAIGVISLENAERGSYTPVVTSTNSDVTPRSPIGFLRLDGVAPSRANTISGAYNFYAEETFQWKTDAVSADQAAFLEAFATKSGEISTFSLLSSTVQGGIAALSASNGNPSTNPTWIMKANRDGNNCKPATRIFE